MGRRLGRAELAHVPPSSPHDLHAGSCITPGPSTDHCSSPTADAYTSHESCSVQRSWHPQRNGRRWSDWQWTVITVKWHLVAQDGAHTSPITPTAGWSEAGRATCTATRMRRVVSGQFHAIQWPEPVHWGTRCESQTAHLSFAAWQTIVPQTAEDHVGDELDRHAA